MIAEELNGTHVTKQLLVVDDFDKRAVSGKVATIKHVQGKVMITFFGIGEVVFPREARVEVVTS